MWSIPGWLAHAGRILRVSEHTERLDDLTERIAAAKEFL